MIPEPPRKYKLTRGEDFYIKKLLKEAKIGDYMSREPITIRVDEPFSKVPERLSRHHIRHLPVIDKEGKLLGIVTQSDLYQIISPHKLLDGSIHFDQETLDNIILGAVMTTELFVLHPGDSIGDALLHMAQKKYGCIPIVDKDNYLRGIITQIDILKIAAQIYLE